MARRKTEEPAAPQSGDIVTREQRGRCMGYYLVVGIAGEFEPGPCDPFATLAEREAYRKMIQNGVEIKSDDSKTFTYRVIEEKEVTTTSYWGGGTRTYMQRTWVNKGEWPYAVGPIIPYSSRLSVRRIAKADGSPLRSKGKVTLWGMNDMSLISDETITQMILDAERVLEETRERAASLRELLANLSNPEFFKPKARRTGRKRIKVVKATTVKKNWREKLSLELECGHTIERPTRSDGKTPSFVLGCAECEKEAEAAKVATSAA